MSEDLSTSPKDDQASPSASVRDLLLVSAWFGLVAGLLEGIAKGILLAVPGYVAHASPEILWIAPAFNTLFFLLMGVGLGVVFSLLDRAPDLRVAAALFGWAFLFGVSLLVGGLHQVAALILSLGVAVVIARRLPSQGRCLSAPARRSAPTLVAVALLLGAAGGAWEGLQERARVARLPPAEQGVPHVLFITLDTVRADHVSAYGYRRRTTPNLDRLAQGGVLFEAAFANSSWTLPAHASMFTGRLPHEHGAEWGIPLDGRYPVLAEVLAGRGYATGAFSANTEYVTREWGLGRGFLRFEAFGSSVADDALRTVYGKKLALNILPRLGYYDIPGRKRAATVNAELLSWLDGVKGRPFFAFLNYFDVHDPYITVEPYRTRFSSHVTRGDRVNFQLGVTFRRRPQLTAEEIQMEIDSYDGALAYLDAQLGHLFAELARRGLDQDTLVIVASDHGEAFGNHDLFGHGNSLYLETLHVPLILSWPGRIPAGVRVSRAVGLHQIPATVMALLDGRESKPFPGKPLAALWSADPAPGPTDPILAELNPGRFAQGPAHYPTGGGDLKSLITDREHFVQSAARGTELYRWREDYREAANLAENAEHRTLVQQLKQQLKDLLESSRRAVSPLYHGSTMTDTGPSSSTNPR